MTQEAMTELEIAIIVEIKAQAEIEEAEEEWKEIESMQAEHGVAAVVATEKTRDMAGRMLLLAAKSALI